MSDSRPITAGPLRSAVSTVAGAAAGGARAWFGRSVAGFGQEVSAGPPRASATASARTARVSVAMALVGLALTGCARHAADFGEPAHGEGLPAGASIEQVPPLPAPWQGVDRGRPEQVVLATVNAVLEWHPERGEVGPEVAVARARPLFTAGGAESYRPFPLSRRTWEGWMDTRALVSVESAISTEEHPGDTAGTWRRKVVSQVTITVPGQASSSLMIVSAVLARKQPGWTVAELVHLPGA